MAARISATTCASCMMEKIEEWCEEKEVGLWESASLFKV